MSLLTERNAMVSAHYGRQPSIDEVRRSFAHHDGMPELRPLGKPCHDCAITCGFFTPYAAALSLLTPAEIERHSRQWFCHNNCNRACAGNIEYQAAILNAAPPVNADGGAK